MIITLDTSSDAPALLRGYIVGLLALIVLRHDVDVPPQRSSDGNLLALKTATCFVEPKYGESSGMLVESNLPEGEMVYMMPSIAMLSPRSRIPMKLDLVARRDER